MTTIQIPDLTGAQAHDILTTALEGGYMEEFTVTRVERDSDLNVTLIIATCEDHGSPQSIYTFDADCVRSGWNRMVEQFYASGSYLGSQVREGIQDMLTDPESGTPGVMDAIGCDAVLQLAAWGEVVFG